MRDKQALVFKQSGKLYCKIDFQLLFSHKCTKCSELIKGQCFEVDDVCFSTLYRVAAYLHIFRNIITRDVSRVKSVRRQLRNISNGGGDFAAQSIVQWKHSVFATSAKVIFDLRMQLLRLECCIFSSVCIALLFVSSLHPACFKCKSCACSLTKARHKLDGLNLHCVECADIALNEARDNPEKLISVCLYALFTGFNVFMCFIDYWKNSIISPTDCRRYQSSSATADWAEFGLTPLYERP